MSKGDVYSCWKRFCNYENNFSNRADELQYTILKKTRTLAGETGNRGHRRQSKGSDLSARGKGQQGVVIAPSAHHQVMAGPWLLPLSLHTRMPSRETIIFFPDGRSFHLLLPINASWSFEIWNQLPLLCAWLFSYRSAMHLMCNRHKH